MLRDARGSPARRRRVVAPPRSTPASIRHLLSRCLDRDTSRRLRDIGEARIVLDDLKVSPLAGSGANAAVPPVKSLRWRLVALAAAASDRSASGSAPSSGRQVVRAPFTSLASRFQQPLATRCCSTRSPRLQHHAGRHAHRLQGGGRVDSNRLFVHTVDELDP